MIFVDLINNISLLLSMSIIKEHHGELTLESKPGEYTKFNVDLPMDNGWGLEENRVYEPRKGES